MSKFLKRDACAPFDSNKRDTHRTKATAEGEGCGQVRTDGLSEAATKNWVPGVAGYIWNTSRDDISPWAITAGGGRALCSTVSSRHLTQFVFQTMSYSISRVGHPREPQTDC